MNNLKKNINNILLHINNNGVIIYNRLNSIQIKIINYHLNMIMINKYNNYVLGYHIKIKIIKNKYKL